MTLWIRTLWKVNMIEQLVGKVGPSVFMPHHCAQAKMSYTPAIINFRVRRTVEKDEVLELCASDDFYDVINVFRVSENITCSV